MKKLILFSTVLVLLLIFQNQANAQTSGNAIVEASADVIAALSVNKDRDLDFGQVALGSTSTIDLSSSSNGRVTITGESGVSVTVNLTATGAINQLSNGGDNITIDNFAVSSSENSDGTGSNSLLDEATTNGTFTLDAATMFLFFTGEISPNGVSTGNYTNTYTVEVTYN